MSYEYSDITSWDSLNMDWADPNPYQRKYWMAIQKAMNQRYVYAYFNYSPHEDVQWPCLTQNNFLDSNNIKMMYTRLNELMQRFFNVDDVIAQNTIYFTQPTSTRLYNNFSRTFVMSKDMQINDKNNIVVDYDTEETYQNPGGSSMDFATLPKSIFYNACQNNTLNKIFLYKRGATNIYLKNNYIKNENVTNILKSFLTGAYATLNSMSSMYIPTYGQPKSYGYYRSGFASIYSYDETISDLWDQVDEELQDQNDETMSRGSTWQIIQNYTVTSRDTQLYHTTQEVWYCEMDVLCGNREHEYCFIDFTSFSDIIQMPNFKIIYAKMHPYIPGYIKNIMHNEYTTYELIHKFQNIQYTNHFATAEELDTFYIKDYGVLQDTITIGDDSKSKCYTGIAIPGKVTQQDQVHGNIKCDVMLYFPYLDISNCLRFKL